MRPAARAGRPTARPPPGNCRGSTDARHSPFAHIRASDQHWTYMHTEPRQFPGGGRAVGRPARAAGRMSTRKLSVFPCSLTG
eukprot:gene4874-biopygen1990